MKNYDFKLVEPELAKHWKKIDLLKTLETKNKKGKPYFLLEGPPYANNVLHVGHLRNIFYKDLNQRYQFMLGKDVLFTAGFDTHGLPIENMVEKKLGFQTKKDILKFGVNKFTKECKKLANLNVKSQMEIYNIYGCWMGWDTDPYLTYNNSYLESAWWSFKKMWDKNQVYKGLRPVHWCPHCETSLAGIEVEMKEKTDPAIYAKFKLKSEDAYLVVYTTTPWTLPSNVVIAAAPKGEYVKVKTSKGNLILAENGLKLLDRLNISYKVLSKFEGNALEGKEYLPLFKLPTQDSLNGNKKARRIVMSVPILKERIPPKAAEKSGKKAGDVFEEFVSTEEGTGLVHVAPGHGKTDNEVGKYYGLPEISPLNDACEFTGDAGKYEGQFVKDADPEIIEDLKDNGSVLHNEKVRHSYPICWRCKNGLIFRLSKQWFFKTDPIRKKLLSENNKIRWMPGFAKDRMDKWLANLIDWNFTRQRFWGIPVNIWINDEDPKDTFVPESKKDLENYMGKKLSENYDLHNVIELEFPSKKGKGTMRKIPDIFDVWYDSGVATWAWMGAPFQNNKQFEKHFPVDRISEGMDQVSAWFNSLLYTSVSVFGKAPFKEVSMPAFSVDAKGEKMSKSIGNVVWADAGIKSLGADLIRFYYMSNVAPYDLAKFNVEEVKKETFGVINTLWNLHSYLLSEYPTIPTKVKLTAPEDKWIISVLNHLVKAYHEHFDTFWYHMIGRSLTEFIVEELSRTYIQLVRDRIEEKDEEVGYVLFKCISEVSKLLAPISPFVADKIYLDLAKYGLKEQSVHLERLPQVNKSAMDGELVKEFELIKSVISDVLALRDKTRRNLRWPIKEVTVVSSSRKITSTLKKYENLISKQTNSLNISTKSKLEGVRYDLRLNFKRLGKEYGKQIQGINKEFSKQNVEEVIKGLNKSGFNLKVSGKNIKLHEEDIIVKIILPSDITGVASKDYLVYIDLDETEDMKKSGFSREIVRKVQDMRKSKGMKKTDKIHLEIDAPEKLDLGYIKSKTNASQIELLSKLAQKEQDSVDVRGMKFKIALGKA